MLRIAAIRRPRATLTPPTRNSLRLRPTLVIQRSSSSGVERALFFRCSALGRTQALEALGPEGAGDRHVPGSVHPRLHPRLGGEQPQPPGPPVGKD